MPGLAGRTSRPRFEDVTETTGVALAVEGAEMMCTRYSLAAELAMGKRVLELGCGAGQGFGLLARSAASLVGGDYSLGLLRAARRHYGPGIRLVRLSAETLPFRAGAFDLVLCFEMSYYVADMSAAFREVARVLTRQGAIVFVNANPERPDFIRSPYSVHYHSADEFRTQLEALRFTVTVEGAFPVVRHAGRLTALVRRLLEALNLVPRTLRGRARLKRLVSGRLLEVPAELREGFASVAPRTPVPPGPVRGYKVIYVTARKRGDAGR